MKIIDNRNDILHEDLKQEIQKGSKLSIIATLLSEISGMEDFERCLNQSGFSMDAVYENIVRQIAGDALKGKIRKEKQLNRQMQMNGELKQLKKELGAL